MAPSVADPFHTISEHWHHVRNWSYTPLADLFPSSFWIQNQAVSLFFSIFLFGFAVFHIGCTLG